MYLFSSALIFFIDWDFSLGHMSIDLSSVLAALASPMVPSVTGTNNQVASPHGCLPGLATPEPSSALINPGQHLQAFIDCILQFNQCTGVGLTKEITRFSNFSLADFSKLFEKWRLLLCTIIVDDKIQRSIVPVSVLATFFSSIWQWKNQTRIEGGLTNG